MKNNKLATGLLLMVLLLNMDITIFSVILAPIAVSLHLTLSSAAWIFSIYLLFFAAFIVISGRLGDKFGHRRVLFVGLGLFVSASIIAALASHVWILFVGRALLAIGAALIWPNITVMMMQIFAKQRQAFAMSLIAGMVGLGQALGPVLGGIILHWLSWHWIFWMNVPLSLLTFLSVWSAPQKQNVTSKISLPWFNTLLLTISLGLLALGINQIPATAQWHHYAVWLLLLAAIGLGSFFMAERKTHTPLISPSLLKNAQFLQACLFRVLTVIVIYSVLFVIGLFLQQHWQLSVLQTSGYFLAMTVSMAALSPVMGKLIDRYGARTILAIAASLSVIGSLWISLAATSSHAYTIIGPLMLLGIGFAGAGPAVLILAMSAVDEKTKGAAAGVFYMVSLISGLIIVAIDAGFISAQHAKQITVSAVWHSFSLLVVTNVLVLVMLFGLWALRKGKLKLRALTQD